MKKSIRIMEKMGFKVGRGLGKSLHGIVTPPAANGHEGRHGLGYASGPGRLTYAIHFRAAQETTN